jgi:hypothetical protein
MSHTDKLERNFKRQTLAENFHKRSGQTRAKRADLGVKRSIAEQLDEDTSFDFWSWESTWGSCEEICDQYMVESPEELDDETVSALLWLFGWDTPPSQR